MCTVKLRSFVEGLDRLVHPGPISITSVVAGSPWPVATIGGDQNPPPRGVLRSSRDRCVRESGVGVHFALQIARLLLYADVVAQSWFILKPPLVM